MLNEEEIVLKKLKDTLGVLTGNYAITQLNFQIREMVEDCIGVIEKQSKEIEEYKKQLDLDYVKNNYTSNDKIKAKICECKEILYLMEEEMKLKANKDKYVNKESVNCLLGQISILQSLLEKE